MKRASVRDLRYRFPEVEACLREGHEVEITKRRKVIARLVPTRRRSKPVKQWPDFLARLRKIYGNRKLEVTGAELIAQERDRY